MKPKRYVLDACVALDMLSADEPRHERALALETALAEEGAICVAPATLLVEIFTAAAASSRAYGRPLRMGRKSTSVWPFDLSIVPIDQSFVAKYVAKRVRFPHDMPRGGDAPYFFLAISENIPLLTEDRPLRKLAERWRAPVMGIAEVMSDLGR